MTKEEIYKKITSLISVGNDGYDYTDYTKLKRVIIESLDETYNQALEDVKNSEDVKDWDANGSKYIFIESIDKLKK